MSMRLGVRSGILSFALAIPVVIVSCHAIIIIISSFISEVRCTVRNCQLCPPIHFQQVQGFHDGKPFQREQEFWALMPTD